MNVADQLARYKVLKRATERLLSHRLQSRPLQPDVVAVQIPLPDGSPASGWTVVLVLDGHYAEKEDAEGIVSLWRRDLQDTLKALDALNPKYR